MMNLGVLETSSYTSISALRSVILVLKDRVRKLALLGVSISGSGLTWKKSEQKDGQLKVQMQIQPSVEVSPGSVVTNSLEREHSSKTVSKFLPITDSNLNCYLPKLTHGIMKGLPLK
jgi:hypothetical protein